jgi:hypothetical protein
VFALMMSASYVRCVCKQAEGQPHTPAQCDRHIVLSLTHHAMLQRGLETLRVADYLWKREEGDKWALFCHLHSWSPSLSPTQSLRLAPLPLTDDIIHPSFPLPCMELPVLTLQRRTWNMPYFGLREGGLMILFCLFWRGTWVSSPRLCWRKLARSLIQGCSVVGNTRRSRHEKRA